jgi:hypothetical protein
LYIANITGRIADTFAKHGFGVVVDQALDGIRMIGFGMDSANRTVTPTSRSKAANKVWVVPYS